MNRVLRGALGHKGQRLGEPEEGGAGVAFIEQPDPVGNVESHDPLAILLGQGGLLGGEPGLLLRDHPILIRQLAHDPRLPRLPQVKRRGEHGDDRDHGPRPLNKAKASLDASKPSHRAPALHQGQLGVHLCRSLVALLRITMAGLEQHFVQFRQRFPVRHLDDVGGQLGKLVPIVAGADLVKHLAEAVDIRLPRAWPFRREETLGSDE